MAFDASAPQALLDTLRQPSPSSCRTEHINFETMGFSEHEKAFAILIHDLLTPDECDGMLKAAEAAAEGQWAAALINAGGQLILANDIRSCDRIMWDNAELAQALFSRIQHHLPRDIQILKDAPHITSDDDVWSSGTWQASRLNERLRFLRYQPGMFFKQHTDGFFVTSDESEVSFLTVHLYLRGSEDLRGGATRFFAEDRPGHVIEYDVNPTSGTCLIFQHYDLVHSGEDVLQGTKYTMRTDVMYRKVQGKDKVEL